MDYQDSFANTPSDNRPVQSPPPWGALRVVPLGGLGEFGKNCMALEYGSDMILIDCGQMFPENEMFGVDMVIPDFSYVLDNIERLRGVVLTHGHEDHIGSIAFFIRQCGEFKIPIYGSRMTMALVRSKLEEMKLSNAAELHDVSGGEHFSLGEFDIECFWAAHSLPQAMCLAVHLPIGIIIHTGDYKIEADQPGTFPEIKTLQQYAADGKILLLMADSTNVDREGISPTEAMVSEGLEPVLASAESTIILATFSSSLHRVQTVLDLAKRLGRKVAICGYSLERNFGIATALGLLRYSDEQLVTLNELTHLPPSKRLILITGTQGEPLSALSRLSLNSFRGYTIQPGDMVVLSSRIIPGNEKSIYRMINHFYRHGAKVVTERDARVHGSGHAYREEMRRILRELRPTFFMPVHGELRQLIHHRDLAIKAGVSEERIFILENGMQLELDESKALMEETDWAGQVLVDGKVIDAVEEVVLRDRKHLSEDGMVTIILVIDRHSHKIIGGPDIVSRGFVVMDDNEDLIEDIKQLVTDTFNGCDKESQEEWDVVKAAVKKAVRKFLRSETDRYPVILPVVLEI